MEEEEVVVEVEEGAVAVCACASQLFSVAGKIVRYVVNVLVIHTMEFL